MENIKNELENVLLEVDELKNLMKILKFKIVATQKHTSKKINALEKKLQKKNKKRKPPSGFAKPSTISSELCNFMNKPPGTMVARTDVTRYLINYIKENNLQDDVNRRSICPDEKLKNLLDVNNNITFFSIQGLMNKHFIKYNESLECVLTN
jgi:chromatin remodeling complex protein RSC6